MCHFKLNLITQSVAATCQKYDNVTFPPGDDTPQLSDLYMSVISIYAAHWEALGAILGIKDYEIAGISKDYANQSTEGCPAMLIN